MLNGSRDTRNGRGTREVFLRGWFLFTSGTAAYSRTYPLSRTGEMGGLTVVTGCEDTTLIVTLGQDDGLLVHGLD